MEFLCLFVKAEIFNMKSLILMAAIFGFATICNAQQKVKEPSKTKVASPVSVKQNSANSKLPPPTVEVVKFTPPVIVKDKPTKALKAKRVQKAKFTPPVIVKDPQ